MMNIKTYVKIIHDFSDKFNNFIILLEDIKRDIESETIQKLLSSGHMYGEFDIQIFPDSYINSIIDIKDNGKYVDKYISYSEYMRKE